MSYATTELLGRVERRRRFSVEQKLAVLTEATAPGANMSAGARRNGLLPAQEYKWRRLAELGVIGVPGDALFDIERAINGQSAEQRRAVRQELSAPLVADLHVWMREQRAKLSPGHDLAKAMNYMLKRWGSFSRFLDDGRICLSNNAAERALRGIALGRKSWLFAGS